MDFGLRGKRALVTGSTAGIGFATARALAIEGAHVTVNGRTEARVGNAVDRISRELSDATVSQLPSAVTRIANVDSGDAPSGGNSSMRSVFPACGCRRASSGHSWSGEHPC